MAIITPEILLDAYRAGIFPMAEGSASDEIFFVDPEQRGVMPIRTFHTPRKVKKIIKKQIFDVTYDTTFKAVLDGCAATGKKNRLDTWINLEIKQLYLALFKQGACHSVEVWLERDLVGGLYGVSLGGVFFGESMFSTISGASKVALVYLVAKLQMGGFTLLDIQFNTEHLTQFGALEITREEYRRRLEAALKTRGEFSSYSEDFDWISRFLQSNTHTS
ncbi:MAG: leucyl/phenylalanyl-tRNA--protein transferase [Rhodospirillaceae bacterium]|nr:leucyl/phenylalanyl-tRNA--protein transferase [Rhodospirillaceae bacterium]